MHEIIKHEAFKFVYKMESKEYPADLNQLINIVNRFKSDPSILEGFEDLPHESGPNFSDLTQSYTDVLEKFVKLKLSEMTSSAILKETVDVTSILIDKINPKSISVALLYGEEDPASGDWIEGISAKVFKECG